MLNNDKNPILKIIAIWTVNEHTPIQSWLFLMASRSEIYYYDILYYTSGACNWVGMWERDYWWIQVIFIIKENYYFFFLRRMILKDNNQTVEREVLWNLEFCTPKYNWLFPWL